MNIALINSIGKNKWGGGEKWLIMAAGGLLSLGHNVVVICRRDSILSQRAKAKNIPVKVIGTNSDFDIHACFKFYSFFKSFRPDVVIGCQNKDWRVASVALKALNSKAKIYSRQGLQLLKNSWWYKWTIKHLSDGIITNTHTIKEYYDSFLPVDNDFIKVIFNGVETTSKNQEKFDYSKYIPSSEKNPVIVLSTGRLARQKGFKYLIDSASKIIEKHNNVYFFLAGQGKLEGELQARIARLGIGHRFFLLGFVEDIHPLLKGADVFVFSSLFEGMPNSILEAMSHALPVVSTNVNGVTELIEDGKNGYSVPSCDVNSMQQALENLIASAEKRKIVGENARKTVVDKFSVNQMVRKLDAFVTGNF